MRGRVHYNLHTLIWSVVALEGPDKGRVIHKAKSVELGGTIKFHVGEKSRQKVIEKRCRSVHAYISGELLSVSDDCGPPTPLPDAEHVDISYNPYKHGFFYVRGTEAPITQARRLTFNADGTGFNEVIATI